jgi:hypothetical protein
MNRRQNIYLGSHFYCFKYYSRPDKDNQPSHYPPWSYDSTLQRSALFVRLAIERYAEAAWYREQVLADGGDIGVDPNAAAAAAAAAAVPAPQQLPPAPPDVLDQAFLADPGDHDELDQPDGATGATD